MKKTVLTVLMAVALMATVANASVTYAPGLGFNAPVNDIGGNPITSGTYVMILDLDNNVPTYLAQPLDGTKTWAELFVGDLIMDIGEIFDGMGFPAYQSPGLSTDIPGYTAGFDHAYLLWFAAPYSGNTVADASVAGPGQGVQYGFADMGLAVSEGGASTPDIDGLDATLVTTTVVPEPASLALLAIGGLVVAARRRRA